MQSWLTKSMGSYTFASCTRSLGTFTWTPFVNDRMSRRVGIAQTRLTAFWRMPSRDKGCLRMIRGRSL